VRRLLETGSDTTSGDIVAVRYAELIKYGLIVVVSTPIIVVYPFIQKYFTKGVMLGAVKS